LDQNQLTELLLRFSHEYGEIKLIASMVDYPTQETIEVLSIKCRNNGFIYIPPETSIIEFFAKKVKDEIKINPVELVGKIKGWIRDAFIRSGTCRHGNIERVMKFIKNYDDIIFAPDTNILLDCIITSILLPEIRERMEEEIKGCPNWILISIPKLVMHEIERKAIKKHKYKNFPERAGWPTYEGRIGQRSLQEILDIDTNEGYRGVSIMTVGEIPSTYNSFKNDQPRWDSEIRYQIKDFISRISFHKGIFFITQDRVSAMMARAEGLQSLYLQKPEYKDLRTEKLQNKDIARVIYEFLVAFGEISIPNLGKFSIFWPEKHVIDWEKSRVMITELFEKPSSKQNNV